MSRSALLQTRDLLRDMPAVPERLSRLRAMLADEHCPLEEIAATIAEDEGLSAGIQSMRRVPFFGTVSKLATARETAFVLGREKLAPLVGILCALQRLDGDDDAARTEAARIWDHAQSVAAAAVKLAVDHLSSKAGGVAHVRRLDRVYAWGLMHDVGRLLLLVHDAEAYFEIEREVASGRGERRSLERDAYGFTHEEVGAAFCLHWGFDRDFVLTVRRHHGGAPRDPLADWIEYGEWTIADDVDRTQPLDPGLRARLGLDD